MQKRNMNIVFNYAIFIASLFVISSCAPDKPRLEGKREAVFKTIDDNIKTDLSIRVEISDDKTNAIWATDGGNEKHNIGNPSLSNNPKEIWSNNLEENFHDGSLIISQPIAVDGSVFALNSKGKVFAFNLDTGATLWSKQLLNEKETKELFIHGGLNYVRGTVYVATGVGKVFALNSESGDQIWEKDFKAPIKTAPNSNGQLLYVQTMKNHIYGVNLATGEKVWEHKSLEEITSLNKGGSPAVSDGIIVGGFSNGELHVLNSEDGKFIWLDKIYHKSRKTSASHLVDISANPIISDDMIFVAGYEDILKVFDMDLGDVVWEKNIGAVNQMSMSKDFLFIITKNQTLLAIRKNDGVVSWSLPLPKKEGVKPFYIGPTLAGNTLWVSSNDGNILKVDPIFGKLEDKIKVSSSSIITAPIVINKTMIVISSSGRIYAYR